MADEGESRSLAQYCKRRMCRANQISLHSPDIMSDRHNQNGRRYSRIATPKGVWVAWQDGARQEVSRVQDLNIGGLFVATERPSTVGTVITILLSVPEGEIRGRAVVRNATPKGMGVEFVELREQDAARLRMLIARLLPASQATAGSDA